MVEEFHDAQEAAREHNLGVVMWSYPRCQGLKNATIPRLLPTQPDSDSNSVQISRKRPC